MLLRTLFLTLISINGLSQSNNDYDSLRKYSYFVVGFNTKKWNKPAESGTGYFIRNTNRLFYITANHILSGCKNGQKDLLAIENMTVWLNNEDGTINSNPIPLNLKMAISNAPCLIPPLGSDVIAYEVLNPNNFTIYSIENFITNIYPEKPESIVIFGYSGSANYRGGEYHNNNSGYYRFTDSPVYTNYQYIRPDGSMAVDSFNYKLDSISGLVGMDTIHGYSGAPVFIKDGKTNKWSLMGQFNMTSDKKQLLFLKPEYILEAIKRPYN